MLFDPMLEKSKVQTTKEKTIFLKLFFEVKSYFNY